MQGASRFVRFRNYGLLAVLLALLASCAVTPPSPTPQGRAAQAQQLLQQGQYAPAAQLYEALAAGAQAETRDDYLISAAEAWWQAGQGQHAWKLLGEVQPTFLTPALNARAELLKAEMDFRSEERRVGKECRSRW